MVHCAPGLASAHSHGATDHGPAAGRPAKRPEAADGIVSLAARGACAGGAARLAAAAAAAGTGGVRRPGRGAAARR
jgi:hypothetical protein